MKHVCVISHGEVRSFVRSQAGQNRWLNCNSQQNVTASILSNHSCHFFVFQRTSLCLTRLPPFPKHVFFLQSPALDFWLFLSKVICWSPRILPGHGSSSLEAYETILHEVCRTDFWVHMAPTLGDDKALADYFFQMILMTHQNDEELLPVGKLSSRSIFTAAVGK